MRMAHRVRLAPPHGARFELEKRFGLQVFRVDERWSSLEATKP